MGELMNDALGVGLAATQVGVLNRVLVYRVQQEAPIAALINPELEWSGPEAERICHALLARDVCTDFRSDGLRISPHFFTDEDDVDRCFAELARLV